MTILFQAKFLILAILFSSINSLVKSETPSHCSELYGCQTEDPQEKIVNRNLGAQLKKDFDRIIETCKYYHRTNKLTYLPISGLWVNTGGGEGWNDSIDLDLSQLKRSEIKGGVKALYYLCPYEFSEYVRSGKEPTFNFSINNSFKKNNYLTQKNKQLEALEMKKKQERKKEQAERERKKQQAITELESKKITLGMGSGFWFNPDGYFATNHHVVQGCKKIQVKVNNELLNSKIISFDKINDLAIGKVNKNIESVFTLSSKPELGEEVMVGGFPLSNVLQNDSIKITRGIVSSLSGLNNNYSMLQIDAPIQQGNSGGPIINSYGEVIGVATSYLRSTKEFDTQNVNFGVKVNLLRNMSESLGINVSKPEKQKAKNSKQLAKVLEKNTVHVHCTNTYKEWVALQNNQESNASLSEHIKLNLKDYIK